MALYEQKRTTFSTQDYADAVYAADPSLTREQAGVLWAQYAIETGKGKFCWNCNIGNVKVTAGQVQAGTDYFMLKGTWKSSTASDKCSTRRTSRRGFDTSTRSLTR